MKKRKNCGNRRKVGGNRLVTGIIKPIIKKTKIVSTVMKVLGFHRLGNHLSQSGYGNHALVGRMRLI